MGNQQSDLGEQEAWNNVIGHIPVVNFFYGGIRAAVYASKDNMTEAHSGAIGMIPFAHNIIHGVVPAVVKKAIQTTEEVFRRKEEELRRQYWVAAGAWDIFVASGKVMARFWRDREGQERLRGVMGNFRRGLGRA